MNFVFNYRVGFTSKTPLVKLLLHEKGFFFADAKKNRELKFQFTVFSFYHHFEKV